VDCALTGDDASATKTKDRTNAWFLLIASFLLIDLLSKAANAPESTKHARASLNDLVEALKWSSENQISSGALYPELGQVERHA
jgi:hypothetical protein